jgi:hypothetical protein
VTRNSKPIVEKHGTYSGKTDGFLIHEFAVCDSIAETWGLSSSNFRLRITFPQEQLQVLVLVTEHTQEGARRTQDYSSFKNKD